MSRWETIIQISKLLGGGIIILLLSLILQKI